MGRPLAVGRRRKWFRARRKLVAVGGTYDDVEYDPLLEGEYLRIERIAVEDETSAPTSIRIYVKGHGYEHWVGEEGSPSSATLYWVTRPTYLVAGEQLVARFTGATASDELVLYIEGWIVDYPLPPGVGAPEGSGEGVE